MGEPQPSRSSLAAVDRQTLSRLVYAALTILVVGALVFSRTIAVPVLAAVLLTLTLTPLVSWLAHLGIPRAAAAAIVIMALVGCGVGTIYVLREPLTNFAARTPEMIRTGHAALLGMSSAPVARVSASQQRQLQIQHEEAATSAVMTTLKPVAAGMTKALITIGTSIVLTFFALTSGSGVGRAVLAAVRGKRDRRAWLRVCSSIRSHASQYLQLVSLINIAFGILAAGIFAMFGVTDALAYGLIAGVMNFIPFIGALVTASVLMAGGVAEHGLNSVALLPVGAFLILHLIEAQFVTPHLLGRRLLLRPLVVILGILIGGTAWGVGGAFLAVPILTALKIALDAHPGYRRWGQVLGRGAMDDGEGVERRMPRNPLRVVPRR